MHQLQQFCCFRRILAPGAYFRTKFVEQKGNWQAAKREERRNGARPLIPEIFVHLGGEQRERGAEQGPKHRVGSQHRRSVDDICIRFSLAYVSLQSDHELRNEYVQESTR